MQVGYRKRAADEPGPSGPGSATTKRAPHRGALFSRKAAGTLRDDLSEMWLPTVAVFRTGPPLEAVAMELTSTSPEPGSAPGSCCASAWDTHRKRPVDTMGLRERATTEADLTGDRHGDSLGLTTGRHIL